MKHRGRGIKVVGHLQFLASETLGLSVGKGSTLRLDNIFFFIFVLASITFVMK